MRPKAVIQGIVMLLVASAWGLAQQTGPSFDCSKADGEIEELICSDGELSSLDVKLSETYARALTSWPSDMVSGQKAIQRGWIKGRNECWKADDKRACTEESYRTRIVELQIRSGALMVPTPVGYRCEGQEAKPFAAVFYGETDPPSAVLTFGDDQVIAFLQPSGSGAKYAAANMEFWEQGGEASVDWYGTRLTCKVASPHSPEASAPGTEFHATGTLACARSEGQPMGRCEFGVVREGDASGFVTVFWPDGGSRVISFEVGAPASYDRSEADGDAEMTFEKSSDVFLIRIGAMRFEIPEAVIFGG